MGVTTNEINAPVTTAALLISAMVGGRLGSAVVGVLGPGEDQTSLKGMRVRGSVCVRVCDLGDALVTTAALLISAVAGGLLGSAVVGVW